MAIGIAALLAGCGGGGGGAPPQVTPATVMSVSFPASGTGDLSPRVELADPESDPADLRFQVSLDNGATWSDARLEDGQTLVGIPTTPAGVAVTIAWDSLADVGFRPRTGVVVRITPRIGAVAGAAFEQSVPAVDRLRDAVARVESYMVHYGAVDDAVLALAKTYELVILHPWAAALEAATVQELMLGAHAADPSDDVIVLAYISVGEDLRTIGVSDAAMLADPRFVGDATGPRIDPRGPDADGGSLVGLDPLGLPTNSPAGTRYASFYLDDNSVDNDPGGVGDGLPDRNAVFGGCFVNAGDPAWLAALDEMRFDVDGYPGIRELLTAGYGRGYACDGLFLDTIDTCAPNSFTDGSSANQSEFEWTAPGFATFMSELRTLYPDKLVLQNRGVFFFDPRHPHYQVTTRAHIDLLMLESYRLDSSAAHGFDDYFFPDNKHNIAPKLMAEANRADGFRVLSLGYAEGPGIKTGTLTGDATGGFATLVEDIVETEQLAGFRHYLTDGLLTVANDFVRVNRVPARDDVTAPVWSSSYNDNVPPFPTPPGAPTPRVGIQQALAGAGCVAVGWDVALDQNRVGYRLYVSTAPFDFAGDPTLAAVTRIDLEPVAGPGYATGVGPGVYPHWAELTGLAPAVEVHLCIRAHDALGNEDANQVVLTATPLEIPSIAIDGVFDDWDTVPVAHLDVADAGASAGPDWREIEIVHDATNLYVRYTSDDAFNVDGSPSYGFSRTLIFVDVDANAATGWSIGGIGSDLLVAGDEAVLQTSGVFNAGALGTVAMLPLTSVTECELAIPWATIDGIAGGASTLRLVFVNDDASDFAPDTGSIVYAAKR